ncbi:MAG TPA: glycoside hydrolase 100 family protein [Stenomitos sp.]
MVSLSWDEIKQLAWQELSQPKYGIYLDGCLVGIKAADVPSEAASVNYDQCFVRDFVPVALLYLINNRSFPSPDGCSSSGCQMVGNFLATLLSLQLTPQNTRETERPHGMMPASFKIEDNRIKPDYGERAIARVTPVDSCLWWLILLRAYYRACSHHPSQLHPDLFDGDQPQPKLRRAIRLILSLYLSHRFDNEPMILVPDGAGMMDRRMGMNGYPLEIQALFYAGLQAACEFLRPNEPHYRLIRRRLQRLHRQINEDYWLNAHRLRILYQAQSEQYGEECPPAIASDADAKERFFNKYNLYPESIPFERLIRWLPEQAGYLVGNLGPSHLDCRFIAIGNLMAVLGNLLPADHAWSLMNLIYLRRDDLLGDMPMKVCYPAIEGLEWQIVTGCDPKNKPWSYHNGGSWPMLTWMLAAAALCVPHQSLVNQLRNDIIKVGNRLIEDRWPEYYDGSNGGLIGRAARRYQTWSIAGVLLAQELLDQPQFIDLIYFGAPQP